MTAEPPIEEVQATAVVGRGQRAVLHSMIGRIAIIVVNAVTGIITARGLLPVGRGEQAAMSLWPVLLANATTLGLPTALSFYLKRPGANRSQLVNAALALAAVSTLVAGIGATLLMPRLLDHYPPFVVLCARLFLLSLPLGSFMMVARAVLEADGHFEISVVSQWLLPATTLVLLLIFLLTHKLTPMTASIAYTANGLPVAFWLFKRLRRSVDLRLQNPLTEAKRLLGYGLPAYGIDLCGTLSGNIDQAMVINFLTADAMGVYAIALSVSRMLSFCQSSVTMVLLPKAAALPPHRVVSLTGHAARATLLISGIAAICVAFLAPFVIRVLYGRDFAGAIAPFRILLVDAVVGGTVVVLAQAAMAVGRPALITILQVCGLIVTIPLMFVLVPRFGLIGAAVSIATSTCMRLVLMMLSFPLLLGHRAPRLWMTRTELLDLVRSGLDVLVPRRFQTWFRTI